MVGRLNQQTRTILSLAIASLPLCILGDLYFLVLRARFFLDRWPLPCNPDPKSLPFDFHYLRVWYSLLGVPLWILISIALLFAINSQYPIGKLTSGLSRLSIVVGMWVLAFTIFTLDPGHYVEWFFD